MTRNLIERVKAAMDSDEESSEKQSRVIEGLYEDATPTERSTLDEAFAALCGYKLSTLIERDPTEED